MSPPKVQWGEDNFCLRSSTSSGSKTRDFGTSGKRSYRDCSQFKSVQGVLFNLFSCSKKGRRFSSNPRSQTPESLPKGVTISHASHGGRPSGNYTGRLVHQCRSKGRLFPCAGSTSSQTVPSLCFRRSGISVQSASFRPLTSPTHIHQMYGCGTCPAAVPGTANSSILRRLASVCPVSETGTQRHVSPAASCVTTRSHSEFCKEFVDTQPTGDLYRHCHKLADHVRHSIPREGGRCGSSHLTYSAAPKSVLWHAPPVDGQNDCHVISSTFGASVPAPTTDLDKQPEPESQAASTQTCAALQPVSPTPPALGEQTFHMPRRDPWLPPFSSGSGCYRCVAHWLGRCMEPQDSQGGLDSPGETSTYKCAGAACGSTSSHAFPSCPERHTCPCPVGQYLHSLSHKPSRGNQVQSLADRSSKTPFVGFALPSESQGSSSTRSGKLCRRSTFETETTARGVEAQSGGGSDDLEEVRCCTGGPLRLKVDNTLPTMVLSVGTGQPVGTGCYGSPVARLPPVCVPSSSTSNADFTQDKSEQSHSVVGCPILARSDMVSLDFQAPPRGTLASPSPRGPAVTAGREHLASTSGASSIAPVAIEGPDFMLNSCDQAVVQTILNARAASTRALYDNRWKLFIGWCESQRVDPERCPVTILLTYLQRLLEKGLSVSTIKVYVAAISAKHILVDGRSVGSHPLVSRFLKGAMRLRPPRLTRVPSWDLPIVLEGLCCPPFEPMESAELKWLSAKTVFLLAISSAKRVGELHALSVAENCLRWHSDGSGVTLWPNPSFLPKRISAFHVNQPISLAVFAPQAEVSTSNFLCPVRMLKHYITLTAGIRKTDALFICYGAYKKGCAVSKQRLSHWVVDAILKAYGSKGLQPPKVTCHSTRGMSTSWAALRGVPLSDICAAASWASSCTFARHYRVNVAAPHPVASVVLSASSVHC